jgi:membrane fusion protein (multidrug efflux system)
VEVKVGLRQPGRVEITEGLQPGDIVVTAGQQRIQKDGMPVRVLELSRQGASAPARQGASAAQGISAAAPAPTRNGANPCGASRT